jgi:hypothetical protein
VIDEALVEVYLRRAGRINFEGAQRAPNDVLADKVNPLRAFSLPIARKDARITRLFVQHRELMNTLDKADPAAAKRLSE